MQKTPVPATAPAVSNTRLLIPCADGYSLHATLREPDTPALGIVLIHPATAVLQTLYSGFADYLTSRGFAVVTYDYRGIGRSRPESIRGFQAGMRDWADLDVEAAIFFRRSGYE